MAQPTELYETHEDLVAAHPAPEDSVSVCKNCDHSGPDCATCTAPF